MSDLEKFLVENMYTITNIIIVLAVAFFMGIIIYIYCTTEKYDKEAMKIVKKYLK